MKKNLLYQLGLLALSLVTFTAQAQFVQSFNGTSLPAGWSNASSTGSTSTNALWKFSGNPGYAMSGTQDNTGNGGSFAWVDGSSPSGLTSRLTSPAVTAPTVPYVDFWIKSNIGTYNTTFNTFSLDFFDGANWNSNVFVFAGNTTNGGWQQFSVALDTFTITGNVQLRFNVGQFGSTAFYNDIALDDINFYNNAPCVAPPTAGMVAVSDTGVCSSDNFTLSLMGAGAGSGMTYQWQSSPDSTTWTNIAGATGATHGLTQSSDTYYRCILTCTGQSDTTAGYLQLMDPFFNCYCSSGASSTTYGYIGQFDFSNVSYTSPTGCGQQYTDNTNLVAAAFLGGTETVSAYINSCTGTFPYNCYVKVWIDYNQNGSFSDPGEEVYSSGGQYFQTFTGQIAIPQTAMTGLTGMRISMQESGNSGLQPCATYTWGEVEDYTIAILPPPANDAGIAAIDTPNSPACAVAGNLHVTLSNLGTDTLNSATINWSVNGTLQTPVTWSGAVAPSSVDTVPSFVANYAFVVGDSIAVWTTLPNGVQDSIGLNDTMSYVVPPVSLSGTFTIDANGAGPTNFTTFDSAVSLLNSVGVCGPVVFNVANGTYVEQIAFDAIAGASNVNTITFQSASGDTALCIVEYTSQGNANNTYDGTVRFNAGASNIHFKNIKFYNPSTFSTYATVVTFNGDAQDISFEGCRFTNDQASTTSTFASLVYKTSSVNLEDISFEGCTFYKGSQGMYWFGSSSNYDKRTHVIDCEFLDQYYRATYMYYQDDAQVVGNTVTSSSTLSFGYGLMNYYWTGKNMRLSNNHVYQQPGNNWPRYGMYVYAFTGDFNKFADVSGNAISMPNGGTYGVYYYNNLFVDFMNNSIYFEDASTNNEGIYVSQGSLNRWVNNAFQAGGQARPAYIITTGAIFESNNNAWSAENNFAYWGGTHADLTAMQSSTGKDSGSVELANIFSDTMNLLVCNDSLDGAGAPNANYMMDLQGDPTDPNAVDIGADQFATASSFAVADTVGLCGPGDTATLEAWYFDSISWNNGAGQGNFYDVTVPGVVVVEAFGICGQAADTITVIQAIPVDLPATSVICTDSIGMIDAGIAGGTYAWSNGDSTQSIMVSTPGTYTVTVTDKDGCVSDDQTTASLSTPADIGADTTALCDGNPATLDAGITNGIYSWTTGDSTQTTTANAAGTYGVTVTDADGCISSDETEVVEFSSPVAGFDIVDVLYYTAEFGNTSQNGTTYAWDFGDGNTSNDANPTHLYDNTNDSATSYVVTLIATNICGSDTITDTVTVGSLVGYNELANGAAYEVFPNPNAGQFNIVLNNTGNQEVGYMVVDVQGKVVTQRNIGAVSNAHQERVDVTGVAPGIYFLRMTIGDETTIERIAIK